MINTRLATRASHRLASNWCWNQLSFSLICASAQPNCEVSARGRSAAAASLRASALLQYDVNTPSSTFQGFFEEFLKESAADA
jgi:hypothetical protein